MAVQILGLRDFVDKKSGRTYKSETFFEKKWRAKSVASLFKNIGRVMEVIPKGEQYNLYYTAASCLEEKGRKLDYQEIVPIDIDGIDTEKIREYIPVVCNVLGVSPDDVGIVATGNGLQFIIGTKQHITDENHFDDTRPIYKALCGKINQALYLHGLVGDADPSVWSKGRLLRLPNTINRKKNKGEKQAVLLQDQIKYLDFSLYDVAEIPEVQEGQHIHPKSFLKMPEPDGPAVLDGCAFLQYCMENQAKVSEPQWYAMLSIVGRLPDGRQLVHKFSEGHPDYNPDHTDYKTEHALEASGPRTCDNIASLWDGCPTCPNFNLCKSPIQIKSEEYIATKDTGFYDVSIDKNGMPKRGKPNYDDLVKHFFNHHPYTTMELANIVHVHDGQKWVDISRNKIHNFAEENFDPKPNNSMCLEFEAKLKRTELQDQDWYHVNGYVNFQNGILKLDDLQLLPHSPELGFKYVLPFEYNPSADCPRFTQFLDEITLGKKDLQAILLEFMGYSLMGIDPAIGQKALILYGNGSNGKSVLIEILRSLAGKDNYSTLSMGYEINKLENRYQLSGKLFNVSEETPTGAMVESSVFKALVSGGEVQARKLYCDSYSMKNYAKIIMACNELPAITDKSHGMVRRLLIVPFQATFTKDNMDVHLIDKLKEELAGIFNLAMQGYKSFINNGSRFTESAYAEAITKSYIQDNDTVLTWMDDECTIGRDNKSPFGALYDNYSFYCERMGLKKETSISFGRRIKDILGSTYGEDCNIRETFNGKRQRGYKGIGLIQGNF